MRGWEGVTLADIARMGRGKGQSPTDLTIPQRRSKYRNQRVEIPGVGRFDSKREADYWLLLKAREDAGEIAELKRQVPFPLMCPSPDRGMNCDVCTYVADFTYLEHGRRVVVDAKGHRTREYLLKRRWLELQEGIVIVEV